MLCRKCRRRHAPPSGHWAVGSDPTFFTDPIFPTRFPTELLTTRWEMAPWNGQQPVKKAIFSGTKRHCKIQDNMGGNGLGNRCSTKRPRTKISRCRASGYRSEEHTSELQSLRHLVCRL